MPSTRLSTECCSQFRNDGKRTMKMIRTNTGYKTICVGGSRKKPKGLWPVFQTSSFLCREGGSARSALKSRPRLADNLPSQKEWQRKTEMAGNKYVICRDIETFIEEVENYLDKFE